jgi:hypothetical protein
VRHRRRDRRPPLVALGGPRDAAAPRGLWLVSDAASRHTSSATQMGVEMARLRDGPAGSA